MRQYERGGVTIEQCTECRGIFLDRGELERISEAENAWNHRQQSAGQYAPPPPPPHGAPHGYAPPPPAYGQQHRGYHGHYHGHFHGHSRRRRRGFLGELFD